MTEPRISAVVCTLDRPESLRRALVSLSRQSLAASDYEIIVVDNRPCEATRHIVDAADGPVRALYFAEPELGLSRARNLGWHVARAPYVAYLDDDAVAGERWLENALAAFATAPRPGCVGGRVRPHWESARPTWLADEMLVSLSTVDWSPVARPLARGEWLVGTNIAFRRELLECIGGFREDLGRIGDRLLSMEERWACEQIESRGHLSLYFPDMEVVHHIAAPRLSRLWFARRYFWQGVSGGRMAAARGSRPSTRSPAVALAALARRVSATVSAGHLFVFCRLVQQLGFVWGRLGLVR